MFRFVVLKQKKLVFKKEHFLKQAHITKYAYLKNTSSDTSLQIVLVQYSKRPKL